MLWVCTAIFAPNEDVLTAQVESQGIQTYALEELLWNIVAQTDVAETQE